MKEMASEHRKSNPKRRLAPKGYYEQSQLEGLLRRVRYSGNPQHKRNPGDFGLTPPSAPKTGKSLCDDTGIVTKAVALSHLKEGLKRGTVCRRRNNGWPKRIWAVTAAGIVLEAIQDSTEGSYHAYPLPPHDDIVAKVRVRWADV